MSVNKNVLITGVTGIIGSKIADCFLREGWTVYGTYFSEENNRSLLSDKIIFLKLDISNTESIDSLMTSLDVNFDAMVNSAGINRPNDFDKINLEDWDDVFSVNLRGVFYLTQKMEAKLNLNSSVINIASFSGQVGGPRTTHYAASKAALISLTQNMARFFAKKNIRVNAVSPGVIESEMAKAAKNLPILNDILLSRLGKPEEVAELVYFLSTEKASYITAQTINVNGGLYF